jgi:hypothetical protein
MDLPLTTTYFDHRIRIEPYEWGYLAHVTRDGADEQLVAVNSSALRALEGAFDVIDENLRASRPRIVSEQFCKTRADGDRVGLRRSAAACG